MSEKTLYSEGKLPLPNWDNVRALYKKLSEEFNILTDSYKIQLSRETKLNLDHLIIVIDDIDQCVDEMPDKASRDSITHSLVDYLGNDELQWSHPKATDLMMKQIEILKTIILKEKIQTEFISAAQKIFEVTELKRHTENMDELIHLIKIEGEATAQLPLSILKINSKSPFGQFFGRLCMIMGIADLVFDARQDYKNGYIQYKPSIALYLKLNWIVITEGLKLIAYFPRKIKFVQYCLKFTIALIKE